MELYLIQVFIHNDNNIEVQCRKRYPRLYNILTRITFIYYLYTYTNTHAYILCSYMQASQTIYYYSHFQTFIQQRNILTCKQQMKHVSKSKKDSKIYLHVFDVSSRKTTQLETVFLNHICGQAERVPGASRQYTL